MTRAISRQDNKLFSKTFLIFLTFAGILLSALYIFQLNAIISKSYNLQGQNKQLGILQQENKLAEIKFLKANSLENTEQLIKNLNFEKIARADYINVLDGQVVVK